MLMANQAINIYFMVNMNISNLWIWVAIHLIFLEN